MPKHQNTLKIVITIAISIAVAVFFMWLALRGLDFTTIRSYFAKADYLWVAAAAFFGILAYWIRALRWNLLLEPLGYKISNSNALWTLSFGYLMNLTIPRSGEVARSTALYGVEKVPVDQSFGTIILERVVDLVCMVGFLILTLVFKYDAIVAFYTKAGLSISPAKAGIFAIMLLVLLFLFFVFRGRLLNVPVLGKVIHFINGILAGTSSILKLRHPFKFMIYSVGIWICYYLAAYLVCFALPETAGFSLADGFFIIVVGTLGMMVPASGGIGAFHFALKMGIGALFLSFGKSFEEGEKVGLAYAFISHTLQLVIMLVMGFIAIPILAKNRNTALKKQEFR